MIQLLKNYKQWLALAVLIGVGLVATSVITKAFNVPANNNTYIGVFVSLVVAAIFSAALIKFRSKSFLSNIDIYLATFLSFTTALATALYISYFPCNFSIIHWAGELFAYTFIGLIVSTVVSIVRHRVAKKSLSIIIFISVVFFLLLLLFSGIQGVPQCDARDARRISDVNQLQLALSQYQSQNPHKFYPATLQELFSAGLIIGVPLDPKTNQPYYYVVNSATAPINYHLGTTLENSENKALCSDADFNSAALGWVNGFNGAGNNPNNFCNGKPNGDANPAIYDVTSEK